MTLSTRNAFLLLLDSEADPTSGQWAGRIEHVGSRISRHFRTLPQLLSFLADPQADPPVSQVEIGESGTPEKTEQKGGSTMNTVRRSIQGAAIGLMLMVAGTVAAQPIDTALTNGVVASFVDRGAIQRDAALVVFRHEEELLEALESPLCPAADSEVALRIDSQQLTVRIPCTDWQQTPKGFRFRDGEGLLAGLNTCVRSTTARLAKS
jgi:hypothetical protein